MEELVCVGPSRCWSYNTALSLVGNRHSFLFSLKDRCCQGPHIGFASSVLHLQERSFTRVNKGPTQVHRSLPCPMLFALGQMFLIFGWFHLNFPAVLSFLLFFIVSLCVFSLPQSFLALLDSFFFPNRKALEQT